MRQHICDHEVTAFSKTPLPTNTSKAPTPDSSNSKATDRSGFETMRQKIVHDFTELKECWLAGTKHLTFDLLQDEFPETYRGRSKGFVDPTAHAHPKALRRYYTPYMLPLHRASSLMETINFGRRFVDEWSHNHNVYHKSRLADGCEPKQAVAN